MMPNGPTRGPADQERAQFRQLGPRLGLTDLRAETAQKLTRAGSR